MPAPAGVPAGNSDGRAAAPLPGAWVYDIGENGDCGVDAAISDNIADVVALFRRLPTAKASFATKNVNRELLAYAP